MLLPILALVSLVMLLRILSRMIARIPGIWLVGRMLKWLALFCLPLPYLYLCAVKLFAGEFTAAAGGLGIVAIMSLPAAIIWLYEVHCPPQKPTPIGGGILSARPVACPHVSGGAGARAP